MAGNGGKRPGAGRKPGIPNKATIARQESVASTGITPLDYMLQLMRDIDAPKDMRFEAAKAAAPYVHPKLSAVEHTGADGEALIPQVEMSDTAIARAVGFILAKGIHDKPTAH